MRDIKLAIRTIKNYPLYTMVNIVGLALSLACAIILARYIYSETTVDAGHAKSERICVVYEENKSGWEPSFSDIFNDTLPLLSDAALLRKTTVMREFATIVIAGTTQPYKVTAWRIDSVFNQIFDFDVIAGDNRLCRGKDEAAITAGFAKQLFGNDDPIGKKIVHGNSTITVTAVIGDIDFKSSFKFDFLFHHQCADNFNGSMYAFFELAAGHSAAALNEKYGDYVDVFENSEPIRYQLMPITDIYMGAAWDYGTYGVFEHGNKRAVSIMFVVMLAVLAVGIFNFVNIYTVMMLRRNRELGLKGIFGAPSATIARGLYVENFVLVSLAVGLGWIVANAFEPLVTGSLGIVAVSNLRFDFMLSAAIIVVIPILTSLYPYIKYRYQKPILTIQNLNSVKGGSVTRSIFLVAQYVITIVIAVVSLFFIKQLDFMLNSDLGYKYENVIKLKMFETPDWLGHEVRRDYRNQMESRTQVVEAQMASSGLFTRWGYCASPGNTSSSFMQNFTVGGVEDNIEITKTASDFFDMFAIPITWGRGWSDSIDSWNSYKMIVNEAFLRHFNITDPASAVVQPKDRLWRLNDGNPITQAEMKTNPPYQIVGVVRDFYNGHLSAGIKPLIFTCNNNFWGSGVRGLVGVDFCAQIVAGKEQQAITMLRDLYTQVGGLNFKYSMVSDEVAAQYAEDKRLTLIFSTFAIIAIIISALGLFSLSLYDIERRVKEIALRRVNGAQVGEISALLLRKYFLLLALSAVIAVPASIYAINWYLADFAVRAPISWWIFAIAIALTSIISLLTIIFQIRRAANTNPTTFL